MLARLKAIGAYVTARLAERSTYMTWLGSIGSVAILPHPFNLIGCAVLFAAGFIPGGK
jgi:hypothetical protein